MTHESSTTLPDTAIRCSRVQWTAGHATLIDTSTGTRPRRPIKPSDASADTGHPFPSTPAQAPVCRRRMKWWRPGRCRGRLSGRRGAAPSRPRRSGTRPAAGHDPLSPAGTGDRFSAVTAAETRRGRRRELGEQCGLCGDCADCADCAADTVRNQDSRLVTMPSPLVSTSG